MMVRSPSGHWRGFVQRDSLFADARALPDQIERLDQFVAGELVLPAEASWDRSASEFRRRQNSWPRCPRPTAS